MLSSDYTAAERQAFIAGMLATCVHLSTPDWVVADMCVMHGVKAEELMEVLTMARRGGKKTVSRVTDPVDPPIVPGIYGAGK